jgi:hypothetical protein
VLTEGARVLLGGAARTDPLPRRTKGEDTCVVVPGAKVENGVPQSGGWFLVNARESRWLHDELGAYCGFEGKDEAAFDELGINLNVLPPGKPMAMYHEEPVGYRSYVPTRSAVVSTWPWIACSSSALPAPASSSRSPSSA